MKRSTFAKLGVSVAILALFSAQAVWSFCGFYVAKADAKLFNKASQVILARDGNRTVLTMVNDFEGDVKDFAVVVPVPTVLQKDQVHVGNPKIVDRLDAYSAPRLVEYFDENPCLLRKYEMDRMENRALMSKASESAVSNKALGVTIEAQFSVGEYDIVILSALQSDGLEIWLNRNGYRIPEGAQSLLKPYIRQKMRFFVAKVNLQEYNKTGFTRLRPLMMAYESPKFMLPIRLGMANAKQAQDLVVYVLSPKGRAEVTDYRTVNLPSDAEIPMYVRDEFADFYKAMFHEAYAREGKNAVFLEYAWDMNWCDPCAATPLTLEELKQAGVFWLDETPVPGGPSSTVIRRPSMIGGAVNVYLTRLHVRYTRDKFPEDLMFEETPNRQNFQARFVLRHPYKGPMECEASKQYQRSLVDRNEREAKTLANLTGWDINKIREKMNLHGETPRPDEWWKKIFGWLR